MSLMDMIESAAGRGALQQIGSRVGLSPQDLETAIGSLAPSLLPKLAEHAQTGGLDNSIAAAPAQRTGTDAATDHGNDILGTIFGSKDVSRSVASDASAQTGIGVDKLKALLPQLASVAAMVIAARRSGGNDAGGGLGGLLGSLGGGGGGGLGGILGGLTGR